MLLLDVAMPGLDGLHLAKALADAGDTVAIVFITAFDQFAVSAFEVAAVDYLLKPFDSARLAKTLEKLRSRASSTENDDALAEADPPRLTPVAPLRKEVEVAEKTFPPAEPQPTTSRARLWEVAQAKLDTLLRMVEEQATGGLGTLASAPGRTGRVVVRMGDRLLLVDQKDVCFASIEEGRISVVTKALEGDSNVRTLEELADQLEPSHFWRAHRSYLVNIQHIREVMPWFKSSYKLRMDDRKGTEIPVSRSQTKRLRELFNL